MLERLRRRRDARARRWVVLATERDDVPGQARRQAVTYGTPGRAAWLARSLARRLAGRLAGAAPGAGAWCGRGRAPFHKVLAPIWLVDLLEHRVVRRVPARGARPGRGLRLQLRPWLGRGLGRYRRWGEAGAIQTVRRTAGASGQPRSACPGGLRRATRVARGRARPSQRPRHAPP